LISRESIATRTTAYHVVPAEAADDVVAAQSMNDVIDRGAKEAVVASGPDDGRRAAVTQDRWRWRWH